MLACCVDCTVRQPMVALASSVAMRMISWHRPYVALVQIEDVAIDCLAAAAAAAAAAAWRNVDVFNYHRPGASDVDSQNVLPKAVAVRVVTVDTVVFMLVVSLCAKQLVCLYKHAVS